MSSKKYFFATFPSDSWKKPLSELSEHVFAILDRMYALFQTYAADSYEQSPRWILHNMMQNSESIFSLGVLDINYGASTSSEGQSVQEPASPLEGDPSSSCLTHVGETTTEDHQEPMEVCENPGGNYKEELKFLIRKNLVRIKSMSIVRQDDSIGVEIDFDPPYMPEISSPKKSEKDTSPSKKTSSPGSADRKKKSPSISPPKRIKATDSRLVASESNQTIDFSDPNILSFLSQRLLSILLFRKTCMKQICDCYKIFQKDVSVFRNLIVNISFVLKNLPMINESYLTNEVLKLRYDLINKSKNMVEKLNPLVEDIIKDKEVLEDCSKKVDEFEKEHTPFLSIKGEPIPTFDDLKRIELGLKKLCKDADDKVILEGERRAILLNSLSDFEWLVNHFVKFLIITELLVPNPTEAS